MHNVEVVFYQQENEINVYTEFTLKCNQEKYGTMGKGFGKKQDLLLVNADLFFDIDLGYFLKISRGQPTQATRYFPETDEIKPAGVTFVPRAIAAASDIKTLIKDSIDFASKPTAGLFLAPRSSDELEDAKKALASWQRKKRAPCLFLDRDGIIIEDSGYPHRKEDLVMISQTMELIKRAKERGWWVIGVSNQAGIAKGLFDRKQLDYFNGLMEDELNKNGASLDAIYYCPFHEDAKVPAYKKASLLRKPKPGLMLSAANDFPIAMNESLMIGDRMTDIFEEMEVNTWLVKGGYDLETTHPHVFLDHQSILDKFNQQTSLNE